MLELTRKRKKTGQRKKMVSTLNSILLNDSKLSCLKDLLPKEDNSYMTVIIVSRHHRILLSELERHKAVCGMMQLDEESSQLKILTDISETMTKYCLFKSKF